LTRASRRRGRPVCGNGATNSILSRMDAHQVLDLTGAPDQQRLHPPPPGPRCTASSSSTCHR
jgi:hypothetical protein